MQDYCNYLSYADDTVFLLGKPNTEQLEVDCFVAQNMAGQYCFDCDLVVNKLKTRELSREDKNYIVIHVLTKY